MKGRHLYLVRMAFVNACIALIILLLFSFKVAHKLPHAISLPSGANEQRRLSGRRGMSEVMVGGSIPNAPPGFSPEPLFAGIHWHQQWEVYPGVFTPGRNPVAKLCAAAQLPADLSGARVLDVGAWNGCFSFECERRGAAAVVAFGLENPEAAGFNRLKAALGSRVSYVQGSVYELSSEQLGTFDLILFFGVLYHLRYPLLAIDRLRTVSRGTVLIETHVLHDRFMLRGRATIIARLLRMSAWFRRTPIWRQYDAYELHPGDRSNWFGPNPCAVIESFRSAGFATEQLAAWGDRAVFRATRAEGLADRLERGSYEGLSLATGAEPAGLVQTSAPTGSGRPESPRNLGQMHG